MCACVSVYIHVCVHLCVCLSVSVLGMLFVLFSTGLVPSKWKEYCETLFIVLACERLDRVLCLPEECTFIELYLQILVLLIKELIGSPGWI